jgi:cysteine desulfurase family protein
MKEEWKMIYLDNAATTLYKPDCVVEAVAAAMRNIGNAGRGAHESALSASRVIYQTRAKLAEMFHAGGPECVAFTMNSTEALNIAIRGILEEGDHAVTTFMEHNSVLRPLYDMERNHGVKLTILKRAQSGNWKVTGEMLEAAIRPETKAFVCTHASNLTGDMNDLTELGQVCREHGILFVVDASQTAGIFPIDMEKMHIDILCYTGHKSLMGPQGTGGLCVRRGLKVRPLLAGGSGVESYSKEHPSVMPTALEAGTLNGHGIAGLHAALSYIEEVGSETLRQAECERMWQFYDGVSKIPGVKLYGDFSDREMLRAPIVTLNIGTLDSGYVSEILSEDYGIETRPGAHCAPLMHEAARTVEQGAVRFSFSHFNTKEEVEQAIRAVRELAGDITGGKAAAEK